MAVMSRGPLNLEGPIEMGGPNFLQGQGCSRQGTCLGLAGARDSALGVCQ